MTGVVVFGEVNGGWWFSLTLTLSLWERGFCSRGRGRGLRS
jgi:hypothetical protein